MQQPVTWDEQVPKASLPSLGDAANSFGVASTEYVVFDTTRVSTTGFITMDPAPAAGVLYRQTCKHIKTAYLSVLADQQLSFYHRHLSILAGASNAEVVAGDWDPVLDKAGTPASPTVIAASANPTIIVIRLFGDDHQLVLKTSGTPPTKVHLSLRLSGDQAQSA
jgi:hypothetical protein